MFEDKTLVCKECGQEFVFTAGERSFTRRRALRTSPSAAKSAVTTERETSEAPERCTTPSALLVALPARFPSSPARIVLSTAATASPR